MASLATGTAKVLRRVPKLNIKDYVNESALYSIAGKASVYAQHTDAQNCDTTRGCNCK